MGTKRRLASNLSSSIVSARRGAVVPSILGVCVVVVLLAMWSVGGGAASWRAAGAAHGIATSGDPAVLQGVLREWRGDVLRRARARDVAEGGVGWGRGTAPLPAHPRSLTTPHLVVHHYNEDLSWLEQRGLGSLTHTVYHAGRPEGVIPDFSGGFVQPASEDGSRFYIPNFGDEASGYLRFIIDHYDALPAVTVFLHGHPARHRADIATQIGCIRGEALHYASLNGEYVAHRVVLDAANDSVARHPGRGGLIFETLWHRLPWAHMGYGSIPRVLSFQCCAQFAVSREAILLRPRAFYERLWSILIDAAGDRQLAAASSGLNVRQFGGVMEHAWHLVFGMPPIVAPQNNCELFSCFRPSKKKRARQGRRAQAEREKRRRPPAATADDDGNGTGHDPAWDGGIFPLDNFDATATCKAQRVGGGCTAAAVAASAVDGNTADAGRPVGDNGTAWNAAEYADAVRRLPVHHALRRGSDDGPRAILVVEAWYGSNCDPLVPRGGPAGYPSAGKWLSSEDHHYMVSAAAAACNGCGACEYTITPPPGYIANRTAVARAFPDVHECAKDYIVRWVCTARVGADVEVQVVAVPGEAVGKVVALSCSLR